MVSSSRVAVKKIIRRSSSKIRVRIPGRNQQLRRDTNIIDMYTKTKGQSLKISLKPASGFIELRYYDTRSKTNILHLTGIQPIISWNILSGLVSTRNHRMGDILMSKDMITDDGISSPAPA